jgi:WD40 repeat protein
MTKRRTMRHFIAVLICAALLSACSASADDAQPAAGPTTERPGSATTTTRPARASEPGGVIVFQANWERPELHAVDLDHYTDRRFAEPIGVAPTFSPDGHRLVYSRLSSANAATPDLYVFDIDAKRERKLAEGSCPTWSPDGTSVVAAHPDGLRRIALDGTVTQIEGAGQTCGIDIGGARFVLWHQDHRLLLLHDGETETLVDAPDCGIGPADASSDLRRIAYTVTCSGAGNERAGLWIMDLDSGTTRKIMEGPVYGASWSPDDRWVATARARELDDGSFRHDLWIARDATDTQIELYEGGVTAPAWGPSS